MCRVRVNLTHRQREPFTGRIQVDPLTAATHHFFFKKTGTYVSVADYYFLVYGLILEFPDEELIRFVDLHDDLGEIITENLFPQEILEVEY